ncbi:MAG: threonylcarbamoyl-AMP synthase [Candidatus Omnitrophica bacterium]|nr:threonylcarbamoyl-AMP synthase [Candidatus Omnitrophota bacterium]
MIRPADRRAIEEAAQRLRRGGLVAFPTETVYGLGVVATTPKAVARVFAIKGRPKFDPLIVHVATPEAARALWRECPEAAQRLMRTFWPGPLTLVLPKTKQIPALVTSGLPTVAVRVPDHPVAIQLLQLVGRPVAAPSANRFGQASPTTAAAVQEELGNDVSLILDGGPTRVGIESTVVAFEEGRPVLLRPGGVTVEQLTAVAGPVTIGERRAAAPEAPGMLERHYAPSTPLYLLDRPVAGEAGQWRAAGGRIGVLLLAPLTMAFPVSAAQVLSQRGDLVEAAANFFQALRRLDQAKVDLIVAVPMPEHGLGRALMDRLTRAAAGWARVEGHGLLIAGRAEEKDRVSV